MPRLGLIWDPSDAFTCVARELGWVARQTVWCGESVSEVAMQMYAFFNSMQLKHTNIMFKKFPKSMKVRRKTSRPRAVEARGPIRPIRPWRDAFRWPSSIAKIWRTPGPDVTRC